MALNAKLVVVGGEVKTAEIKLRLPSTIGRGRGAGIMLPHPLVSRQHCELYESDGRLMVRDLGSLNGTFVNNERISEAAIPPGELLTVGAVTFRAMYDAAEGNGPPSGTGPQIKVRDTTDNGTVRTLPMKAPAAESTEATPPADEEMEFDFDEPLTPVDEEADLPRAGGGKTDATVEEITPPKPPLPPAKAVPKTPVAKAAPPPKPVPAATKPAPAPAAPVPAATKPAPTPAAPVPAPAAPADPAAPGKSSEKTVDFSKIDQTDDNVESVGGDDDDDFGDFLKSLGTK